MSEQESIVEIKQDVVVVLAADENFQQQQQYIATEPIQHGFFADSEDQACTVKVAMRIRPMIGRELREGKGATCVQTTPEMDKLQIGTKEFFFDSVFDTESN